MSQQPMATAPDPASRTRRAWVLLGLLLVFVALVRVRLLEIPIERDEGEYAYAGQLILQGIAPYELAYNMKPPGIYYAYALVLALFGESPTGIHLGLLVVNAGAIALLFAVARWLFDPVVALVAASAFALLTLLPTVLGAQAHATHFAVLPALGGILLVLRASESRGLGAVVGAGLLLGLSLSMKQHAVFYAVFALGHLAWSDLRRAGLGSALALRRSLSFTAALGLPLLALSVVLLASGTLDRFWFWAVEYAAQYVTQVPLSTGLGFFAANTMDLIQGSPGLWAAAAAGLVLSWVDPASRRRAPFVTGFLACTFLTACPGLLFRPHYYVTWLPAVALSIGVAFGAARNLLRGARPPGVSAWLPGATFTVLMLATLWEHRHYLWFTPVEQVSRELYGGNPWPESRRVAEYIEQHSDPSDTIAVLGSEPQIYFFSGRRSATGYIYTYPMMEAQKFASTMQREMIDEITAASPRFVVFVNISSSWLWNSESDMTLFTWAFGDYLKQHYDQIGYTPPYAAPRPSGSGAGTAPEPDVFGPEAKRHSPGRLGDGRLYVFERK